MRHWKFSPCEICIVLAGIFFFEIPRAGAETIAISHFSNIPLTSWSGSGDRSANDPVCVYRDGGTSYSVTVSGTGSSNQFQLQDGFGNSVPLRVRWTDSVGPTDLDRGTIKSGRSGAYTTDLNCTSGDNATIGVEAVATDIAKVPNGNYSASLTVEISP